MEENEETVTTENEERKSHFVEGLKKIGTFLNEHLLDIFCFLLGFALLAIKFKGNSIYANAGDATNTWNYITGVDRSWPYTLYKGIIVAEPYKFLYKTSLWLGLQEQTLIKAFFCVLFGYISGIGFPFIAGVFLKRKQKVIPRILVVLVLFVCFLPSRALTKLMVDLPTCAFFVATVHCAFAIYEKKKTNLFNYLLLGFFLSTCFLSSGQYTIPGLFVIAYILIRAIQSIKEERKLQEKGKLIKRLVIIAVVFLIGVVPIQVLESGFQKNVVSKYDIPDAEDWMNGSYAMRFYTQTFSTIPDYRGEAILRDYYGEEYTDALAAECKNRKHAMSFFDYLELSVKYPVDSICRWCNRFFLCFKCDGEVDSLSQNFYLLFISYTLLFCSLLAIRKNCKTLGDVLQPKTIIVFGFIMAVMPCCVTCVELRYCIQLQGLVYSVGLLYGGVGEALLNGARVIYKCFAEKSLAPLRNNELPTGFFVYCIFILLCFIHLSTIYEMAFKGQQKLLFDFNWDFLKMK